MGLHQEGLRPWAVRRLHGADQRSAHQLVSDPCRHAPGRRHRDDRRPRLAGRPPPDASRLRRMRRLSMRLLHARPDMLGRRHASRSEARVAQPRDRRGGVRADRADRRGNPRADERKDLPWIDNIVRAIRPKKVPVVFTQEEAQSRYYRQRHRRCHLESPEGLHHVFLRIALGISFLSAVADRFGLWGAYGQPNVAWEIFLVLLCIGRS